MFEIESQSLRILWPVLCHSIWSVPSIGLLFGLRIESLSPSRGDKRLRFAILASIAAPFVIALALPALLAVALTFTEPGFKIPAISSRVTRDLPHFGSRHSSVSSVPDRKFEPAHMLSFTTIASESVEWVIPAWLAGMAILTVRIISGTLVFRMCARFHPVDSKSQSTANDLSDRMGLRNPPCVRVSKSVKQPMVMGLFRPQVILPPGWENGFDEEQLEAVLAHELAHIRRRDLVFVLIERIAGIVWFFHPAMHLLNRQAALWREMAADRQATEVTGNRLALARALDSAARFVGGMPKYSTFESIAITFASPLCRGRLGTRIEALLGPEGVCPVKISKKRSALCFVLSFAFAILATRIAAIGQDLQKIKMKPSRSESDTSVGKASSVKDKPGRNTNWIGRMNRVSSKSQRDASDPSPNPTRSFELRLVSVSGNDLDGFLDEKFATFRTDDDHRAWIVDLEPVLNSANSGRRNLIHQAPKTTAADGEPLNFTFTMPVTTVKYHPIHQDGKVRAIKPLPQTTEYDIYSRITGNSGPQSTRIEINGLESMPRTIEIVKSPIQVERPNLPPHGVSETVVTSQSDPFEATAEVPHGKSLVIKLGRTVEEVDDNLLSAAFQLANPRLWNQDVYPYKAMQRYLIVTPNELP